MYIPEEKISQILNASDIVDVVSESVILKKSGRNFFGLCPFHSEKTPSFSVNASKQIFYCFGCGAGGNVISYVMKYHGISFPEAAKMLARKYRIEIENISSDPSYKKALLLKEDLFRLNKTIMEYYGGMFRSSKAAVDARNYLKKRQISDEIIEQFKLGFSSDAWDGVVNLIRQNKVSRKTAIQSGLVLEKKQKNGFYDRFRNRIMFPIFDINMQVAGFGGRVMDDAMPKYMNSPETPVYSKGRLLYGLHAAKQHCRSEESVFIVEGYFDFLSLYQHGVKNSVATLGTALTPDHIRILKGYAKKIVLVFDSDAAGINAAKRSVSLILKEGVDTRILVLPGDNDPDSYVMAHGKEKFLEQARMSKTVMQFLLDLAIDTHGLSVEGRIAVLNEMKQYLVMIEDSALRSLYVKTLSEKLGIDEKAVLDKVKHALMQVKSRGTKLVPSEEEPVQRESDPREKQLISVMLNHPQIIPQVSRSQVISSFYSEKLKRLASIITRSDFTKESFVKNVMAAIDNEEDRETAANLAMNDFEINQNMDHDIDHDLYIDRDVDRDIEKMVQSMINRIVRVRKKQENEITNKLLSAKKGSDAEIMELLKLKQSEIRQLHDF